MTTMLVEGVEHICAAYNDDNGCGFTLCEQRIGPQDVGPRLDETVTCQKCIAIEARNAKGLREKPEAVVARHHKEWSDAGIKVIDMARESAVHRNYVHAIDLLNSAIEHLRKAEVIRGVLKDIEPT